MASKQLFKDLFKNLELLYEKKCSEDLLKLYWEELKDFGDECLVAMVKSHQRDTNYGWRFPFISDLLNQTPKKAQHVEADAAWAMVVKSFDESASVIWTQEMARARELAMPVWRIGDKYGARLAFVAAYKAILARLPPGAIPKWQLSQGSDPQGRVDVIEQAKAMGVISAKQADDLFPSYIKHIATEVKALTAAISGNVLALPTSEATQERLQSVGPSLEKQTRLASVRRLREIAATAVAAVTAKDAEAKRQREESEAKQIQDRAQQILAAAEAKLAETESEVA